MKRLLSSSQSSFPDRHQRVPWPPVPDLLNHQMKNLDGKPLDLCEFSGQVGRRQYRSYCGNTPQYKGWKRFTRSTAIRAWWWSVSGQRFGSQEPGSSKEIKDSAS